MKSLGKFIANKRKFLGMTQEELAEKVHVSKSAIAKWETDGGLPDRDNLKRLSDVLRVSVDDLHQIINCKFEEMDVNITADIINILESYGYEITRPGKKEEQK